MNELAELLKGLRKRDDYAGGPVILDLTGGGDRGTPSLTNSVEVRSGVPRSPLEAGEALAATERLGGPVIVAWDGPLDAIGLAFCCVAVASFVSSDTEIGPIDPVQALHLGLAGRLTDRLGPAEAASLLLGPSADPGTPERTSTLFVREGVPGASPPLTQARALAEQLSDPAAALLLRSLNFAARSTRQQGAEYDRELLALLDPSKFQVQ
jgi:enoyl-CoA hydratase/carnithine racemase